MIGRAEKLFDSLRHDYYLRSLLAHPSSTSSSSSSSFRESVRGQNSHLPDASPRIPAVLYDLILDCYLHKAASLALNATADPFSSFGGSLSGKLVTSPAAAAKAAATTAAIRIYVQRAWAIFGMMSSQRPVFMEGHEVADTDLGNGNPSSSASSGDAPSRPTSVDPLPSAATLGVMMRGIVRLRQLGAYPRVINAPTFSAIRMSRGIARRTRRADVATLASKAKEGLDAVEHERMFQNLYARIPDGVVQQDCPGLDVLLQAAQRHRIALEDVFGNSILQIRMPHAVQEAGEDVPAAGLETIETRSSSAAGVDAARKMRQPSVTDIIQEVSATAERMGNVSLAVQLRALLDAEKEREAGSETRDVLAKDGGSAGSSNPASAPGLTPEELQATVPVVQPVMTTADNNPAVTPTSEGLVEPFNLTNLKENLSIVAQSRKLYADPYDRQEWLELSSIDAARKRLAHAAENLESLGLQQAGTLQSKPLQVLMWNWFQNYQPRLKEELERIEAAKRLTPDEQDILPYLKLLPMNRLALIPILEVMRIIGGTGLSDGVRTARLLIQVGKAVESECMTWVMSQNPSVYSKVRSDQIKMRERGVLDPQTRHSLETNRHATSGESALEQGLPRWTQAVRSRVGGFLVQNLIEIAKVHRSKVDEEGVLWEEDQAAFYASYQYMGGKKVGVVRLNEAISERLDKDNVDDTVPPRHLPMLVPPRLWESPNRGGYLTSRTSMMRFKDSAEQSSYLRAASLNNGLEPVMACLDILGQTAWSVNVDVLRVITELWNRGESVGKLPPQKLEDPEPERPVNFDTDLSLRSVYLQRLRTWALANAALHSQRCDVNYKLEIARAYLGERFYLPHNVDFRGRAYPIPPHFHHLGSDLSRGLLKFADAKPLQATGLRWLRVHLANLYGLDKVSFGDRVQFALDNAENIRKSAEDPINFRWWTEAEDPYQFLAACFELSRAEAHPEGPEAYPCSLPVHQDGTCNGLQHYAALGGDMEGARQVNLSRGDAPADVYTGVAELVIKRVNADAAAGDEAAKLLVGKVTRKVVKQTVMTTVYGVTLIGAKDQVMRRLQDRKDVPAEKIWLAGGYLARLIIDCIGDLFSGAHAIQSWLHDSASLIAKSIPKDRIEHAINYVRPGGGNQTAKVGNRLTLEQMTSVIWQTPLGLPVVQPYRRLKKKQMATAVQTVFIHDPLVCTQVSPAKQASAFPPNFVHSLDATHMMLTALECHSAGLTFASVHDSYWTHACDIDTMSDIIRDTFVRLHSQDILGRLREEFLERYKDHYLPVVRLKATDRATLLKMQAGESFVVDDAPEESGDAAAVEGAALEADVVVEASSGGASSAAADEAEVDESAEVDSIDALDSVETAPEEGEGVPPLDVDAGAVAAEAPVEAPPPAKKKRGPKPKPKVAKAEAPKPMRLRTRFVELSKMIRPIPAKGTFDVSETKKSLYFFS